MITSLVGLELFIAFFLLNVFYPVPVQNVEKFFMEQVCDQGARHYEYSTGPMTFAQFYEIKKDLNELNTKIGFELFKYNSQSPNKVNVLTKLQNISVMGETIGLTHCVDICCGKNEFTIEFSESQFTNPLRAKMLIWHEFGHVIGLIHDDGGKQIMNTYAFSPLDYTPEMEQSYLSELKH